MNELPSEIKTTFILAICMVMMFILFIIFVVVLYNRKRLLFAKEKQLQQVENDKKLLQKEIEQQKSLEHERERISHDMHDDLGAGISALKMQAQFIKHNFPENLQLQEDIDLMIKTSDDMNHSMREMLWSLNTGYNTLGEFIEYLNEYGNDFFRNTRMNFHMTEKDVIPETQMGAIKRRNLFLCLKEAMNNTLKHSQAENITINLQQSQKQLSVILSDDGIGIPIENDLGYGMLTMKKRMQQLNGTFDKIPVQKGTCLKFEVIL